MPTTWIDLGSIKDEVIEEMIEDIDYYEVETNLDDISLEIEYKIKIEIVDIKLHKNT